MWSEADAADKGRFEVLAGKANRLQFADGISAEELSMVRKPVDGVDEGEGGGADQSLS
jgi:hypothetical protein